MIYGSLFKQTRPVVGREKEKQSLSEGEISGSEGWEKYLPLLEHFQNSYFLFLALYPSATVRKASNKAVHQSRILTSLQNTAPTLYHFLLRLLLSFGITYGVNNPVIL
jgi:hypothetical protein